VISGAELESLLTTQRAATEPILNFSTPFVTINDPADFGVHSIPQLGHTNSGPRRIQLGLRLTF
jgi:hypothetical protein